MSSSKPNLGNVLLAMGVITLDDVRDAKNHQDAVNLERKRNNPHAKPMLFGEALVDLGRIDGSLILAALEEQKRQHATSTGGEGKAVVGMVGASIKATHDLLGVIRDSRTVADAIAYACKARS